MRLTRFIALLALLVSSAAWADGCEGFKWNLAREYALYAAGPSHEKSGTDTRSAPALKTDTLYELALTPQADVQFALQPGKKMLTDGTFGGIVSFTVPASGDYRIGIDVPFWMDVISEGKLVMSKDFGGPQGCAKPPHKLVQFELSGGKTYLLQFSGQTLPAVHVSIVKAEPAKG